MNFPSSIPLARSIACLTAIVVMTSPTGGAEDERDEPTKPLPAVITQPEAPGNLRAILAAELAAGNKRIVIPPGRYRVQADREGHLSFSGLTDVEIIAEDVELVCTSTVRAVFFDNCANITLRGLTIDYDPLPFTQGTIVAMAPDKSWIELEIAQGYPDNQLRDPFQIYDPATTTLRRGDSRWSKEIQPLGNRRYRISKAFGYRYDPTKDTEQIGDILVAKNLDGRPGSPHAIELQGCKGMRFENITLHAAPSFGFFERHCHGTTYFRCTIDRRTPDDDPVARAIPRMRSLNADAFHSKDATKGPAILSSTARFMGDDAVNINGRYHYVRGSSGQEVRIAVSDQATIKVGDPVEFLPYSGPRPPDATVVQLRIDPEPLTSGEKDLVRTLGLDARIRASLLEDKALLYTLTLDREIALPPGSAIACSLRLGNGFAVRDCDFSETRSRGVLIKASNGEVAGNRITNTRMAAVLISPEFWWMEAGMASDVVVKDNLIKGCLQTPIQVHARGGNRRILPAGALRNISILNNRIEDSVWPLIHVTSTTGLTIDGNTLPSAPPPFAPAQPVKPIVLEQCETR